MDTLANLFPIDPERLRQELMAHVLAGNAWLASCGREVTAEVADAMVQRLPDALDQRLDRLIASAFRDISPPPPEGAIAMPAEGATAAPVGGTTEERPLPPQRLESRHRPSIELQVGGQSLLSAPFEVSLELRLRDFALRLRDGVPVAVRTGAATASGLLQLEGRLLARFHDRALRLPAVLLLERSRL